MDDDVATSMTRALFLAPSLIDERELDPLLAQAIQNVDDEAAEAAAAVEARKAAAAKPAAAPPRPAKTFHADSTPEFRASVTELVRIVGRRFVAVIGGAMKTGDVHAWMIGESVPTPEHRARLRLAFQVVTKLRKRLDDKAIAEWFFAKNDTLDGQTPISIVCLQSGAATEERLVAAAE
ncbi:MAG: hypothetical protein ACRENA_13190 [Vulcanimicrobiaceae bacterium]